MNINAGLVGLPNVGKSTLFNLLTESAIPAENYPFCTIDPHVAITEVPDERLTKLIEFYKPKKIVPATANFVDIAGLVKGAASGEGLGNKFLSHIREVDLMLHVLRCFEDPNIMHTGDTIDPLADYEIITSELMLKDLESVIHRLEKIEKLIRSAAHQPQVKKTLEDEKELLEQLKQALDTGDVSKVQNIWTKRTVQTIPLLAPKDFLIIANISEDQLEDEAYKENKQYQTLVKQFGQDKVIPVCAKVEQELAQLDKEDAQAMMNMLGLTQKSLDAIIKKTYKNLGLITFFTCGPKEVHAWPIKKGTTVRKAAGEIHSDLERGFICADVFNYTDLLATGSEQALKEQGKVRTEGQDYVVQDGDVIHVKFNV